MISEPSSSQPTISIAELICQDLRKRILSGEYSAGMQLRQGEIAAKIGVSHIPVREALQMLKSEGLVEQFANRGAFVAQISLQELSDVWSLRRILETEATTQAVSKITQSELDHAGAILKTASQTTDNLELVRLNWEFHLSIYAPCGNGLLVDFIRNLYRKADRYSCILWNSHDYGAQAEAEHAEILECYRQRDVERAVGCVLRHIDEVERLVRASF